MLDTDRGTSFEITDKWSTIEPYEPYEPYEPFEAEGGATQFLSTNESAFKEIKKWAMK